MRAFTDDEKRLLQIINTSKNGNLYSIINPWIKGTQFEVAIKNKNVEIFFDSDYLHTTGKSYQTRIEEIQSILIQAVNLIKLFEDKGYIFTFKNSSELSDPFIFGEAIMTNPTSVYHFPDPRLSELIVKYSTQSILITPELTRFIHKDKFKTREERRANRQFITTLTALFVATTTMTLNIIFNVKNIRNNKKNREIQHQMHLKSSDTLKE